MDTIVNFFRSIEPKFIPIYLIFAIFVGALVVEFIKLIIFLIRHKF